MYYRFFLEDEDQAREFADWVDFYGKQLPVSADGFGVGFGTDVWEFLSGQGEDAEWYARMYLGREALFHDVSIFTRPGRVLR